MMYQIDEGSGRVIASDTQSSVAAIDEAVLSYSRLCASIVEVSSSSKLPVSTLQRALSSAAQGMMAAIQSREEISKATRELLKVQSVSNLKTTAFGCPGGLFPVTGSAITSHAEIEEDV